LAMLWTWQMGDIGNTPGFDGDHVTALQAITASRSVVPAEKDVSFPPEDEQWANEHIPNGECRVIPGVWGHFAGSGDSAVDLKYIDAGVKEPLTACGHLCTIGCINHS